MHRIVISWSIDGPLIELGSAFDVNPVILELQESLVFVRRHLSQTFDDFGPLGGMIVVNMGFDSNENTIRERIHALVVATISISQVDLVCVPGALVESQNKFMREVFCVVPGGLA